MKFVDEFYEYYKDRLTADEEDIDLVVAALLQEFSREDMLIILAELNHNDLYKITGTFIADELRKKMIDEQSSEQINDEKTHFYH